ncbi:MAG TPA: carboxymuconolactone decarboxylase family protein, partial [Dehalococcoidia bacterium]|nr:carboxymuconolactone decarboxylase family protein [Dehalococcoidia bacterium]
GSLIVPFNAMLYSPVAGDAVQSLGATLRFETSLPQNLAELAIIVTAREWTAQFEWWAHARMAVSAGVDASIVDAVRERRQPKFTDPAESAIYDFCSELLGTRRVGDATYAATREILGEAGVMELVWLQGYYGLVSMTLNVVEIPLPDGVETPLEL